MDKQISLNTKFVGDITGRFFVPSYQRGYRWSSVEVLRLLNDILELDTKKYFGKEERIYCLQPVVVRKKEDSYELIDGQQRLTTIYLIYKYLSSILPGICEGPTFSLSYETRDKSEAFLRELDLSRREENIDFWFMANAYETIENWFKEDAKRTRGIHIFQYFAENVKVIWYEVGADEAAISLFTRLNIGRIPLTSSELVKAMFLSGSVGEDETVSERERSRRQDEISLQWDNMEKELHNDSLWYFLTNRTGTKYQTRIDLVLDLIAGKRPEDRESYYTFFMLEEKGRKEGLRKLWEDITLTFLNLKSWYEDHELYHKIGYLIASDSETLLDLYQRAENKTKAGFRAELDELITESIKIKGDYAALRYDTAQGYRNISKLLLLFNVESVRQSADQTQRFPFDKFKSNNGKNVMWSLEHIHAQNSEALRKQEQWKEWLELHLASIKAVCSDQEELIKEMQLAIDNEKLLGEDFNALQEKVRGKLSADGGADDIHSISNLALLNTANNAALNNSTFDVKRNAIIRMDKNGEYIPFCTKMVFLKYYTPSEENQLHFWGHVDRVAYVKEINRVLDSYLTEHIEVEREEA